MFWISDDSSGGGLVNLACVVCCPCVLTDINQNWWQTVLANVLWDLVFAVGASFLGVITFASGALATGDVSGYVYLAQVALFLL